MKLSITLPDPKYCNGCPCSSCELNDSTMTCKYACNFGFELPKHEHGLVLRPQICKDKNGE